MNILARTAAAFLAVSPVVISGTVLDPDTLGTFRGSGIVTDSLGVPVKGAVITRMSDNATTKTGKDGSWSLVDPTTRTDKLADATDVRLGRIQLGSGRLRLLPGLDRDVAGRHKGAFPGVVAAERSAFAPRSAAAKDSVIVVASGWRSTKIAYTAGMSGVKTALELAPSRGMVAVRGGYDSLGTASLPNNKVHVVRVAGFWIDTNEVTQKQFDSLLGYNPSYHKNCQSCPVEQVTWFDAVRFCNARSRAEGLPEVYDTSNPDSLLWTWDLTIPGYRLPTDAEWEYAARAGSPYDWYWGPFINKETVVQYAWYDQNAGDSSHPVGLLKPNGFGLHDVSGNVAEWTNDWFEDLGSDSALYPKGKTTIQLWKSLRGGDFYSQNTSIIVTQRPPSLPSTRWHSIGFRCARGVMP